MPQNSIHEYRRLQGKLLPIEQAVANIDSNCWHDMPAPVPAAHCLRKHFPHPATSALRRARGCLIYVENALQRRTRLHAAGDACRVRHCRYGLGRSLRHGREQQCDGTCCEPISGSRIARQIASSGAGTRRIPGCRRKHRRRRRRLSLANQSKPDCRRDAAADQLRRC